MRDDLKAAASSFFILCGNQWTLLFLCILSFVVDCFFTTVMLSEGVLVAAVVVAFVAVVQVSIRLRDQLRRR